MNSEYSLIRIGSAGSTFYTLIWGAARLLILIPHVARCVLVGHRSQQRVGVLRGPLLPVRLCVLITSSPVAPVVAVRRSIIYILQLGRLLTRVSLCWCTAYLVAFIDDDLESSVVCGGHSNILYLAGNRSARESGNRAHRGDFLPIHWIKSHLLDSLFPEKYLNTVSLLRSLCCVNY